MIALLAALFFSLNRAYVFNGNDYKDGEIAQEILRMGSK